MDKKRNDKSGSLFVVLTGLVMFLIIFSGTIVIWSGLRTEIRGSYQTAFESETAAIIRQLNSEIKAITGVLYSLKGFFDTSEVVTSDQFDLFLETSKAEARFPGFFAAGYLDWVSRSGKHSYEKLVASEFPNFKIVPEGERELYAVLRRARVFKGTPPLIGFDVLSDPLRAEALLTARDTGEPALSGRVESVIEKGTYVFFVALPVYRKGAVLTTVDERRESLIGFVVASYDPSRFFADFSSKLVSSATDFEVFGGTDLTEAQLYFDSDSGVVEAYKIEDPGVLSKSVVLPVLGREWTIFFTFHPSRVLMSPQLVLFSGIVFSVLFPFSFVLLFLSRIRAVNIAEKMTVELAKFKLMADQSRIHIMFTDPDGKIIYANPAAEAITGYSLSEMVGNNPRLWGGLMGKEFYQRMWHVIKEEKKTFKSEIVNRRKNGQFYTSIITISPILDKRGGLLGFVGLEEDITERKRLEELLKTSELKFRSLIEKSSDVVALLDGEGKILYESPSLLRVLGYMPEDLIGKKFFEIMYPNDLPALNIAFAELLRRGTDGSMLTQYRLKHKDGDWRWIESIATNALAIPSIKAVILNYRDISDRKQVEEKLKLSEDQYRTLAEAARDMIFVINREGIITYVNSFGAKQFGLEPRDMVGKPRTTYFGNGVSERQNHSIREVFEGGEPIYRETETPFGPKKIWLGTWLVPLKNEKGEIISIMGVSRDITEAKVLANKLVDQAKVISEEKAKDEAVIENIGEGLVALDQDGTIIAFNSQAEKLLFWKSEEVLGKHFRQVWQLLDKDGNVVPVESRPIEQVLVTGKTITSSEYFYTRKDGSTVQVETVVSPIIVEGRTIGMVDVFRDITREKEVDRMKTEFISLASHQLRTPLSAMKWFLEILLTDQVGGLNDKQKESIQNVNESNERMVALVNSLLNIGRIEANRVIVEPELADMEKLVKDTVERLKNDADKKKQNISISVAPDVPKVMVDTKLIGQVYINLLTNAIKYSPEGANIGIEVVKDGESVISSVSDNGFGIPSDEQQRVFGKFYRGSNIVKFETEGTGLGLYLAKMIVEQSGGKIWFKSEGGGKGTTFSFSLSLTGMKPKAGEVSLEEVRI